MLQYTGIAAADQINRDEALPLPSILKKRQKKIQRRDEAMPRLYTIKIFCIGLPADGDNCAALRRARADGNAAASSFANVVVGLGRGGGGG